MEYRHPRNFSISIIINRTNASVGRIGYLDAEDSSLDEENGLDDKAMIGVYAVIMLLGFYGNLRVLQMICCGSATSNTYNSITNVFIFNLALADLLVTALLPAVLARMVWGQWMLGLVACRAYFTVDGVSKFASVAFIVLLSLDRYLAICCPLTAMKRRTRTFAFASTASAWILAICLMLPMWWFAGLRDYGEPMDHSAVDYRHREQSPDYRNQSYTAMVGALEYFDDYAPFAAGPLNESSWAGGKSITQCLLFVKNETWNRIFVIYNFALSYLIPLVLIYSFYLMIICGLRRRISKFNTNRRVVQHRLLERVMVAENGSGDSAVNGGRAPKLNTNPSVKQSNIRRSTTNSCRRTTILILLIVLAYTFCWLPYWVIQVALTMDIEAFSFLSYPFFRLISIVVFALQIANSTLNPYFYIVHCRYTAANTGPAANKNTNNNTNNNNSKHGYELSSGVIASNRRRFEPCSSIGSNMVVLNHNGLGCPTTAIASELDHSEAKGTTGL